MEIMMKIDQASKILAKMYANAAKGRKAASIHLFGIQYAEQIKNMSARDIVIGADLPESYKTEIRKGINLAEYVQVK